MSRILRIKNWIWFYPFCYHDVFEKISNSRFGVVCCTCKSLKKNQGSKDIERNKQTNRQVDKQTEIEIETETYFQMLIVHKLVKFQK